MNKLYAKTPSKLIKYECFIKTTKVKDLFAYEDASKFSNLCKVGCKNYNIKWSCPPYSPNFSRYVNGYEYLQICLLTVNLNQFDYIKNDYLKVKAANTILKSRIDKALREMLINGRAYISTGSCRLCKPCKCKINLPCAHPKTMTYSFEALGINVSSMLKSVFSFDLIWYKKNCLPLYTSVTAGLLTNYPVSEELLINALRSQDKI